MSNTTISFVAAEGINKLKKLAEEIETCLFCTSLKTNDGATCRPMEVQKVDEEGNLWFFSDTNSEKNSEIKRDKEVQLFFAHPGISSYMVVNGEAEIIVDRKAIDELWSPIVEIWFDDGREDPTVSLIKVKTKSAYYWDTDGNRMVNFFKMLVSVATGTTLIEGNEGMINV
jgi:general stress protein 26